MASKKHLVMMNGINKMANEAENGTENVIVLSSQQSDQGEKISVHRRKIGSVTIFDVTETELTILEKGTDASVWLNFFIATLSIGVSFFVSLLTAEWSNSISLTRIIFICITVIMFLAAIICFVFWKREQGQHKETIMKIRERSIQ